MSGSIEDIATGLWRRARDDEQAVVRLDAAIWDDDAATMRRKLGS